MSGKGNCFDNLMVETFFRPLKAELVWRTIFGLGIKPRAQSAVTSTASTAIRPPPFGALEVHQPSFSSRRADVNRKRSPQMPGKSSKLTLEALRAETDLLFGDMVGRHPAATEPSGEARW